MIRKKPRSICIDLWRKKNFSNTSFQYDCTYLFIVEKSNKGERRDKKGTEERTRMCQ